jgi:predicted dinucleotide-binding enzyme
MRNQVLRLSNTPSPSPTLPPTPTMWICILQAGTGRKAGDSPMPNSSSLRYLSSGSREFNRLPAHGSESGYPPSVREFRNPAINKQAIFVNHQYLRFVIMIKHEKMKIAILGTGTVGQTLGEKLVTLDHEVIMGTRNVAVTQSRKNGYNNGGPSYADWHSKNQTVQLKTFEEAVREGDMVINALHADAIIPVIQACKRSDFDHKILVDIANPLDFSQGFPPSLLPGLHNTSSLGEEIQKELPNARVVKTLNTMWCGIMVNPGMVNQGDHQNYICGNDQEAKEEVTELLLSFGWKKENILDLGDITNARGTESVLLIWTRIFGTLGNGAFNLKIVK